jgi:hypothetical protein
MSKSIIISDFLCQKLNWKEDDNEFLLVIATDDVDGATVAITPARLIEIEDYDIIVNAKTIE